MKYNIILITMLYNDSKRILLAKRNREPDINKWSLPGGVGALEKEKDPKKAVALEFMNDFIVESPVNFDLFTMKYTDSEEPTLRLYFYAKIKDNLKIKSTKTMKEIKWFSVFNVLTLDLAFRETDKDAIKQFGKQILS